LEEKERLIREENKKVRDEEIAKIVDRLSANNEDIVKDMNDNFDKKI